MNQENQRLVSLDVFRGMTIFLMIIVNTPGAGALPFPSLLHAEWHGFTLTDLVFPSFLFAVGNSIPLAAKKWKNLPSAVIVQKILKRAVLIFLIGYFLNWYTSMHWNVNGQLRFSSFSNLRISGVLQRIAICYLFAALAAPFFNTKQLLGISAGILFGYWAVVFAGNPIDPYSITGNVVRKLDLMLIGENWMYREKGIIFDPEGILSSFPAIVNVLAGVLVGKLILKAGPGYGTITQIMVAGSLFMLAGICWSWVFPLNKKLWTSSFVLYTIGIDLLVMGVLLYKHEVKKIFIGVYFFCVYGRNPLFIYILSNLLLVFFILPVAKTDLYTYVNIQFFQHYFPGPWGSLLFATFIALLCWMAGWLMDKRKIYVRI